MTQLHVCTPGYVLLYISFNKLIASHYFDFESFVSFRETNPGNPHWQLSYGVLGSLLAVALQCMFAEASESADVTKLL